jgi:hypothetical protein
MGAANGLCRFLNSPAPGPRWWALAKPVITSGTLVSLHAAQSLGLVREELFIDELDLESA